MKYLLSMIFILSLTLACDQDKTMDGIDYAYHAHIKSPKGESYGLGDTVHVNVLFESHSGEPVHNVLVEVYPENDPSTIIFTYKEHVHATESFLDYHEDIVLDDFAGWTTSVTYVVKAAVWGTESDTDGLSSEEVKFSIQ